MGRKKVIQDEALLAIARERFVAKGIGASTREIAHLAGISEAVIYQRFPKKADLFFAAMTPPALVLEHVLAASSEHDDVCGRLEEAALVLMQYFREFVPILVPLMSHPSFSFDQFVQRQPESPLARIRDRLVDYLETQQKLGRVASDSVGPTVLTLVAALHSFALFEKLGVHGGQFGENDIRAMVRSLWRGLASPDGQSSGTAP